MTRTWSAIDLPRLPSPQSITPVSAEQELSDLLALFRKFYPDHDTLLESDPVMKLCEAFAYRLALEKQRRNEAFRAVMLAYATGADLDQLGANVNVQRLSITPADPSTLPPTPAVMESDDDFRARIQLSPESTSTAGSRGSYAYWAKSASAQVADVQVTSPQPGEVVLYIMARDGTGAASDDLLDLVYNAVNADDVRPLTDHLIVRSATVIPYSITATLELYCGPDSSVVLKAAQKALDTYTASVHRLGYMVATSGIYAALQQAGVRNVILKDWRGDMVMQDGQVSACTSTSLTIAGIGDD